MTDCGKRILSSSGPRPSDRQIDAVAQGQRSRMAKKSATGASPRSTEPSRNVTEMPDAVDTMATISATGRLLSPMAISVPSMTMSFDAMPQNLASGFIYCSLKSFSNGNITKHHVIIACDSVLFGFQGLSTARTEREWTELRDIAPAERTRHRGQVHGSV